MGGGPPKDSWQKDQMMMGKQQIQSGKDNVKEF
jgi:hypothetical protein